MISTSKEFEAALESELERLTKQAIAEYKESDNFYHALEKAAVEQMKNINPFIANQSSGETLRLYLSPADLEVFWHIDIEKAIDTEIVESDYTDLRFILGRLELMASKIRETLKEA
jgi:N-methylhydantoinase A/oxoprolinase/acetone carboxylase beta subunit